jgi:hypothetical protein
VIGRFDNKIFNTFIASGAGGMVIDDYKVTISTTAPTDSAAAATSQWRRRTRAP